MNEEPQRFDEPANKDVHCRRNDRLKSAAEHERCPYCFGRLDEIEDGVHEQFCSYDADRDPLNFGFRPDSDRFLHG